MYGDSDDGEGESDGDDEGVDFDNESLTVRDSAPLPSEADNEGRMPESCEETADTNNAILNPSEWMGSSPKQQDQQQEQQQEQQEQQEQLRPESSISTATDRGQRKPFHNQEHSEPAGTLPVASISQGNHYSDHHHNSDHHSDYNYEADLVPTGLRPLTASMVDSLPSSGLRRHRTGLNSSRTSRTTSMRSF